MSTKSLWLLTVLLTGCTFSEAPSRDPDSTPTLAQTAGEPHVIRTESGLSALIAADIEHSGDAAVAGSLAVLGGGCVGVRVGEKKYLVVWPYTTDIVGSGVLQLALPNGGILEEGDFFEGAGGFYSAPLPDSVPSIPKGCTPQDEILVLSEVEVL